MDSRRPQDDLTQGVLVGHVAAGAHSARLQAEEAGLPAHPHIVHAAVPAHAPRLAQLAAAPPAGRCLRGDNPSFRWLPRAATSSPFAQHEGLMGIMRRHHYPVSACFNLLLCHSIPLRPQQIRSKTLSAGLGARMHGAMSPCQIE